MAYILGFLFADGNIICTKRGTWFWSIQITDKNILYEIRKALFSSHKISQKKKVIGLKQQYRLQVGSKIMCRDLISLGLNPRKSKSLRFPKVPDLYINDFIRGYFDGDGGIWIGYTNKHRKKPTKAISSYFTSGSRIFLEELKGILKKHKLRGGSVVVKQRGFDLKFSIRDTLKLYEIMYNRGGKILFLPRKKKKFEKYIHLRS